jgi:arylsulfatase
LRREKKMSTIQPNIILFTTDQQRGDHLSIAGHPVVETPNVDAFVNRGCYFPHAYSEIPSTTGARRCLLSGKGSYDCGLIGYSAAEWKEENTLARVLADNGYHCMNVGFRNLHPRRKLYGFHHVVCHDMHEPEDDYWEWLKEKTGMESWERGHGCDGNGWLARPWHLEERYHPTVWTNNTALEMIRKRDPSKPFFIWISHLRPHSPYDPPKFFWDMYINRKLPDIPVGDWAEENGKCSYVPDRTAWCGRFTPEQNQRMRAGYMGSCTHLDYELGRFMEVLSRPHWEEKERLLDNSLILYLSDHGDMMGDHHLHRKTYAYEGSARIAFLMRYPEGSSLPTGIFPHVVGLQDVMPTILDFLKIEPPRGTTGRSVLDAINGKRWREFIHGEHSPCYSTREAMQYLTDGKEKYIYFPANGKELLFNLKDDPQELKNLSKVPGYKKHVEHWRGRLIKILGKRGDGFSNGKKLLVRKEWWLPEVKE